MDQTAEVEVRARLDGIVEPRPEGREGPMQTFESQADRLRRVNVDWRTDRFGNRLDRHILGAEPAINIGEAIQPEASFVIDHCHCGFVGHRNPVETPNSGGLSCCQPSLLDEIPFDLSTPSGVNVKPGFNSGKMDRRHLGECLASPTSRSRLPGQRAARAVKTTGFRVVKTTRSGRLWTTGE